MTAAPVFTEFSLPAALDSVRPATRALLETARGWDIGPAFGSLFELALEEVVVNAVKHGGQRADGKISCELELAGSVLYIRVFDAGPGFDPAAIPAPVPRRDVPQELTETGYGLAIVRSVFTRVEPVWRGNVFGIQLSIDVPRTQSVS